MLNSNQIAATHVLLRDLPKFYGSPKEWPMFISSFESSTVTDGYTNTENLIRLRRCLQGKALDAVRSILLTPANVPSVIETLGMVFGRPDLIIHSILQQVRDEPSPRMEKLETNINFALAVRNMCSIINASSMQSHMNNPDLMQELVDKLPSSLKRWNEIKEKKLCSTCLTVHRRFQCKDKKKCKEIGCDAEHHIMLHKEPAKTSAVHYNLNFSHTVIYRIIPVILYGPSTSALTYAYLDGGSGITLLEGSLAETLGIEGENIGLNLKWTSKIQRSEPNSMRIGLQISDIFGTERYEMNNVRTVRNLELPEQTITKDLIEHYSYLKDIPIQTYEKAVYRILIGLENINLIVSLQTVEGNWQEPVATKTRLGWVLQGGPQYYSKKSVYCLPMSESQSDSDLHQLVKNYFSIESFGVKVPEKIIESKQSERARQIMETSIIIENGRSESRLLWKTDEVQFPNNKAMAMKRLEGLERRMAKDDTLGQNMKCHLTGYQIKNYTRKLSQEEVDSTDSRIWYMPIFPAFDPKKPEKFRIVWDAAADVAGVSLNFNLLTGQDLLVPLPDILHRFREKAIAVDGDIKETFHQIEVRPEDQNARRFLWRSGNQSREPETFVMQRLTFGAICSPSIAQFVKDRNAKRYEVQYPLVVNSIIKNHYVDNMIDCTHTVNEAVKLVEKVKYIHRQAGFELCKFRSISTEVLKRLGVNLEGQAVNLSFDPTIERILGMFWQISTDTFTFSLQFTKLNEEFLKGNRRPTKREVLRIIMTIFDPLGLLSYFLIYAKILLQEIWCSNIGWDDKITDVQLVKWTTWIEMLPEIENLHIPRIYSRKLSPNDPQSVELHIFVDASEVAYAAVAYLRIENEDGVECVLVGSKTRVAPLKPISIPRLELQAGFLDSNVLLQWQHSETRKYRQFVEYRVGEILELTNLDEWRWVPSKDNVADDATIWAKNPIMSTRNRWFTGPEFLKENNNWEMDWSAFKYEDVEEEIKFQTSYQELLLPKCPNPQRFSKLERLLRAQSYVLRVVYNVETIFKHPISTPLTTDDLTLTEFSLFRRAQFDGLGEEVALMNWNKDNPKKSPKCLDTSSSILRCSLYLDVNQILKVHGKIDATPGLTLDNRRPIILPRCHRITQLIIDWYHRRFHHTSHETVSNELKQRFYIPRMRVALKNVVLKCQLCKERRARPVIRSVKNSFYHILQDKRLPYKILKNVLRECQRIVNSRPLTFVSVDSVESEALTPYHFLIGSSGGVAEACKVPENEKFIRRHWITSQMLINQFWTRWVRKYLPTITRRTKWFRDTKPIEVGDVVYIVDEKLKRYSWPRGMVEEVFIGSNGQSRSAKVKVYNRDEEKVKTYHRPVSKLAVLDVLPQPSSTPNIPSTTVQPLVQQPNLPLSSLDRASGTTEDRNDVTGGENVGVPPY